MTRSRRSDIPRVRAIQDLSARVQLPKVVSSIPESTSTMPPTIVINDDDDDVRISSPRSFALAKSSFSMRQRSRAENRDAVESGRPTEDHLELRLGPYPQSGKGTNPVRRTETQRRSNFTIDLTSPAFDSDCILINEFVQKKRKPQVPAEIARPEPAKELKLTCAICMDTMKEETSTICGHIFCARCIEGAIKFQKRCPTCRLKLNANSTHRIYISGSLR